MDKKRTSAKKLGTHLIDTIVAFFVILIILGIAGAKQEGSGFILLLAFLCLLIVQLYFWCKKYLFLKKEVRDE